MNFPSGDHTGKRSSTALNVSRLIVRRTVCQIQISFCWSGMSRANCVPSGETRGYTVRAIRSPGRLLHAATIDPDEAPLIQRFPLRSVDNRAVVGYVEYPPTYDIPEGGRLADDGGAPYLELRRHIIPPRRKTRNPCAVTRGSSPSSRTLVFPVSRLSAAICVGLFGAAMLKSNVQATWKEMRPRVYLSDRSCHRLCSTACVGDTHEAGRI